MSVSKLLGRIVAPSAREFDASVAETGRALHDHTYGITSDPLTQFSCVLSALIHDADHPGVPNTQLVREQTVEAEKYKNKSVAEQNSVDRCWNLLMQPQYEELRKTIYTTTAGLTRFRSLVVNVSYCFTHSLLYLHESCWSFYAELHLQSRLTIFLPLSW